MNAYVERRVIMPNGRREADSEYDALWCKAEHERINKKFDRIFDPDGYMARIHKRIDNLWYLLIGVGVIGIANLLATTVVG